MARLGWTTAIIVLGLGLIGGAQVSDDQVWQEYLQWLRTVPVVDGPGEAIGKFEGSLKARGLPPPEIQQRMSTALRLMRERPEAWPLIFDKIYASANPNFSVKPSALLLSAITGRVPGRALDVGMGQGRNALALAITGWDVTGFDISAEGLAVARAQAVRAGVTITALQQAVDRFDLGSNQWDLIAVIYGPGPLADPAYVRRLHRSLRPAGVVVVESFASDKTDVRRRPVDIDPTDLRRAFEPLFRLVQFEDASGTSEWDPQTTRLVRMVAEKK